MSEYIDAHGETLEYSPIASLTPYQAECRKLVAFKLKTIETVAADPRLHGAPCAQAIVVYLSFLKIDRQTLRPTTVYASSLTLMARGGIKSDRTARNARALLIDNGYLVSSGTSTKDGCVRYDVANPRADAVAMHIHDAVEYLRERDADRKKEDRRKKAAHTNILVETTTPQKACPSRNYQDVPVETTNKYLREPLRDSFSERRDHLHRQKGRISYASTHEVEEANLPLPIPCSDDEARNMIDAICEGAAVLPIIRKRLASMLQAGVLTPNLAAGMIGRRQEEDAA
ncbi:hypothetical protein EOS93_20170 [Rhizobium sp. RMa-01]|uniref:hypothetical protein n=1 Tax=unclassified Rhizobium TaxID=2613769 RepID=UPI0008D9361C|nr:MULTISPECIES: hypothetical protein [unclassified Rhizobium]OHV18440.1 hypothetical protein BBJ66_19510 [Rhizobium sp. RSm-3]RVU09175.1 hypothetical protein EOS93_20170 [Rhizobium sp. RMa-01]